MGLDMYLNGSKYRKYNLEESYKQHKAFPKQEIYELGYWRKHPDLHGYIVETFVGGKDECQEIYLEVAEMMLIIEAIRNDQLPDTVGFFFGESVNDDFQKDEAIQIFEEAIKWAQIEDDKFFRQVFYQASW